MYVLGMYVLGTSGFSQEHPSVAHSSTTHLSLCNWSPLYFILVTEKQTQETEKPNTLPANYWMTLRNVELISRQKLNS